ncbi:alpha/beta hydrolase [Idiomarina tyrosinivorans]|uniref:Alpha/beta hydrolase n=1 Tax=Idiomarina tyrosinivorans TaxID=1445662 RepID=A0A432ZQ09_9GAMM|nr:alpha/beta hydrolase [Idiomarina tyrosinivorans]RUO79963.1 alpha/beta hydrolase [Idiomarina tyrosinivorans]
MKTTHKQQRRARILLAIAPLFTALGLFLATQVHADDIVQVQTQGSGQDVVLIPGLMSDASVWQGTAARLAAHYKVHILSIAGFGENPANPQLQQQFLDPVTKAINRYLQQHTQRPVVVGHSLGGTLTYKLAIEHPQSLRCGVSVDGVPFLPALMMRNADVTVAMMKPQAQQMRAAFTHLSQQQLRQQAQQGVAIQATSQQDQQKVLALAEQSDPQTAGQAMYALMVNDLRDNLAAIQVPMLQMAATGGFSERAQQQHALQLYREQIAGNPNIQLLEFANARHFIMWDQPQKFVQQLNHFIKEACHE